MEQNFLCEMRQIGPRDGVEAVRDAEYFSMGLFNRKKQATERVQDLKSRVESLRKVDDEHRALTLDDFLQGDDTVTSRSEPRLTPASQGATSSALPDEGSLEAELQRYLQRQESEEATAQEPEEDAVVAMSDWGFDAPASEAPQPMRPISIEEFPPLPSPEERYVVEVEDEPQPRPTTGQGHNPPRLSAAEEAALIAELQRYVQPEPAETIEAETVASLPAPEVLATEDFSWSESPAEAEPIGETFAPSFDVVEMFVEPVAKLEDFVEPAEDVESGQAELEEPEDASFFLQEEEPAPKIVQIDGRTYEEPAPRHWPSLPLPSDDEEPARPEVEPARWPKAAGDWEPL